ncbi:MAG: hypothetical protein ABUT39_07110 [Acidobacteriota bacterium]
MADGTPGGGLEARSVAGAMTTMRLDELVSNLAIGIARGQMALDQACMDIAKFMSEAQVAFGKRPGSDQPDLLSLIELGFTPNFYQFVDTVLELRVAVSTKFEEKREEDTSSTRLHTDEVDRQSSYANQQSSSYTGMNWAWSWWGGYQTSSSAQASQAAGSSSFKAKSIDLATVDAKYASTYNYAVEASSVVKTKIVPVPPPAVFEEIVRAKVQERREWERRLRLTEEARALFLGQMGAVDAMLARLAAISTVANEDNRSKSAALYEAAAKLQESHGALTNEHWALTRSVADRAAADSRMSAVLARSAAIRDDGAAPAEIKEALQAELTAYKAIADSLQKRLAATGAA